ncbi:hypothetical protein A2631_03935 [Candidatus Daviesbacteria bacterium RIFCSPHIGHO2_01_FULL_44_29]|uniref:histidine kinase n=1 Tax=Candidatus Daviesbacteria bacterium RIFCSPHIGHO2_02_FULL_43_12 TaxID=1797776 RepID=A0A1F5KG10_9BACT|nr:MAG: hypothetical protein A2631_03935 [Candidatus Daviesbacteria bacterium RIFCSPHIGHO2_01_FULL_44_29]OGE39882.1 MAG: hypothetical protein A3D25_03665 [Candidatus Daviesbacteria bacterium RIFCSPHIGHO2_02_FULL_43_12]OGE40679.1 MAG: hypothetical protein A3E86_04215 [Candidatus Daviesbacteria bacterium RIFCSPHIGHO2_12_FULL_47_45]OGE70437.1 MAG: hypothetical protein A3B55_01905 [Candidatus Daviesbacteria bacterium RIFCSPLOWO2_01_FULL_43_15]
MDSETILQKINKAALRFLEPLTAELTFAVIIEEALKLVDGDEGMIALEEDGEFKVVAAVPAALLSVKLRRRGFTYASYSQRKAFVIYPDDYLNAHPEAAEMGIRSSLFIPLSYRNKSIGVLSIMSHKKEAKFSNKELEILKLFGSMASLAIRKTQLYNETREALEARDMFLSMAAHEFRTPITTISGYAQMLKLRFSDQQAVEKRWSGEIYGETNRLLRLVNELLAVNRIKTGKLDFHWRESSLREVIKRSLAAFAFTHPSRSAVFIDDQNFSDVIVGDLDKLLQVFTNILDNAAKFSTPDKEIIIKLYSKKDEVLVSIQDQGQGIAKKDLQKVLEGFYRGVNNQKEGMGLGLYISKEIIEQHHGEIKIKSKVNKGTTVEIILPKTSIRAKPEKSPQVD